MPGWESSSVGSRLTKLFAAGGRRAPRLLAFLAGALLLLVGVSGSIRVSPGEVAVLVAGGSAREVLEPGRHWRPPFVHAVLTLPRRPVDAWPGAAVRLAGQNGLRLELRGRFWVVPGQESRFVTATGARPFRRAITALSEAALREAANRTSPTDLIGWGGQHQVEMDLAARLESAGISSSGLELTPALADDDPALSELRRHLTRLARPTGRKVVIVGWDGADWLLLKPLLAQGRLPHLKGLVERGAAGELRASPPLLSPLIWTSMATGKPVTEHGVADFLVRDGERLVPIGSRARRVHALWTLLPAFGLRTHAVAWWASWPAERTLGVLVSDRVAYQLFEVGAPASAQGQVYPPQAWSWIREALVPVEKVSRADLERFVVLQPGDLAPTSDATRPQPVVQLRRILATTRSYQAIALALLETPADLTLLYYEGTDTVAHLFARYLPPAAPSVPVAETRRFARALPEFYAYADELLGEVLARVPSDAVVILVSDHGFFSGVVRPGDDPDVTAGAPQWHRAQGLLVAAGPGVSKGAVVNATPLDLAPTVLGLLGLPLPRDMPGRALFGSPVAGRPLESYQMLPRPERQDAVQSEATDRARIRELAALGYVSASIANTQDQAGADAGNAPAFLATEAYNLGRIQQQGGDLAAAEASFRRAIQRQPSFGSGHAALAQALSLQGRHAEALAALRTGLQTSETVPLSALAGLVEAGRHSHRLEDAAAALQGVAPRYRGTAAYRAAQGLLAEEQGQLDAAELHYAAALKLDPIDQLALERRLTRLQHTGKHAEVGALLARARSHAHGSLGSLNFLGVLCLRLGHGVHAEGVFREVLRSDPGNPGVLANLGASLAQVGRYAEAAQALQESLQRDPENAQNHFNLGAMQAALGQPSEALRTFETAQRKGLRGSRVHVAIGKLRFRMGQREAARSQLQQALRIEPGDREASDLLASLTDGNE